MMREWWGLLRDTVSRWSGHKDARLGAALAYYSKFSLGPLIVIAIAIAGLVFGAEAVQAQMFGTLRGLLGESGTQAIDAMLKGANRPREGLIATSHRRGHARVRGGRRDGPAQDAMNSVWEVETPPGSGIWRFARTYILSLAGVLAVGFLPIRNAAWCKWCTSCTRPFPCEVLHQRRSRDAIDLASSFVGFTFFASGARGH